MPRGRRASCRAPARRPHPCRPTHPCVRQWPSLVQRPATPRPIAQGTSPTSRRRQPTRRPQHTPCPPGRTAPARHPGRVATAASQPPPQDQRSRASPVLGTRETRTARRRAKAARAASRPAAQRNCRSPGATKCARPRPATQAPAAHPPTRSLAAKDPPTAPRPAPPNWRHAASSRCSARGRGDRRSPARPAPRDPLSRGRCRQAPPIGDRSAPLTRGRRCGAPPGWEIGWPCLFPHGSRLGARTQT